jgi:peroxiredoxin (alkyl hydroperoxide reductase subunit C)
MALAEISGDFERADCNLLCISADSIPTHLAFLRSVNRYRRGGPVALRLGQDPEGVLRHRWGLAAGQKYLWLIGPNGKPRAHFSYPAEVGINFTEVYRALLALRTGKPTPCGWVPEAHPLALPPQTLDESRYFMQEQERRGGIALDWYLSFDTK